MIECGCRWGFSHGLGTKEFGSESRIRCYQNAEGRKATNRCLTKITRYRGGPVSTGEDHWHPSLRCDHHPLGLIPHVIRVENPWMMSGTRDRYHTFTFIVGVLPGTLTALSRSSWHSVGIAS